MGMESGGATEGIHRASGRGVTADDLRALVADAAGKQVPAAVTQDAFDALVVELGDRQKLAQFLSDVATENEWPIIVQMGGQSACLPPADWSQERTRDFVAGLHESLAAEFGNIAAVTPDSLPR
jgi:hypothetical protein